MLDLRGWNAQDGGALALILGDQRARDIVAVARALFDRIARRHPVALGVEQHPGEQARLVSACAGGALGGIAGEPHLNRIPQRLVDDWRVFARIGLSLVDDLAAVGTVPQHQVERPTREWLAANRPIRGTRPRLAFASLGVELFLQQPHRAEFGIAAKDRAHEFGLAVDDDQLAVLRPRYPSGGTPPIHIPFFFEAAILSRMRSPMTSRSNCAKDSRTLRVSRPIEVVVLNCCVTETNDALLASRISTILAKSVSERVSRSIL